MTTATPKASRIETRHADPTHPTPIAETDDRFSALPPSPTRAKTDRSINFSTAC